MSKVATKTLRTGVKALEDSLFKTEFDLTPRKNAYYYKYEIAKLARQGATGIHAAVELFNEMKSVSRLTPECTHFSTLIYGCARTGHTKKAFELYDESLKYINAPPNSVITCLINACAESPFREYGLERLDWLLAHARVNYPHRNFNEIQYNAAIKAYGKLGELEKASKLIQEMIDNKVFPTSDTFNMLLIGCASNPEAGAAIALRVFKRMKMFDLKPDLVTYRLFLRCIRDCGMGPPHLIEQILRELPAVSSLDQRLKYKSLKKSRGREMRERSNFAWAPLLADIGSSLKEAVKVVDSSLVQVESKSKKSDSFETLLNSNKPENTIVSISDETTLPNLLSDDHLNLVLRIKSIRVDKLITAADRLALFGGMQGFLQAMLRDKCQPDIKTFSLLLKCIHPTKKNYLSYHETSEVFKIKRDRLFYDIVIECIGGDNLGLDFAMNFLEKMQSDGIRPQVSTFEALALSCRVWKNANRLINDLESSGLVVSDKIYRQFFYVAIKRRDTYFLVRLIELSEEKNFKPSKILVEKLEDCRLACHQMILEEEKKQPADRKMNPKHIEWYDTFKVKMGDWLRKVDLDEEEHPWAQMKEKSRRDPTREFQSKFVEHFKALNEAKMDALKRGGPIGNLSNKAQQIIDQSKR